MIAFKSISVKFQKFAPNSAIIVPCSVCVMFLVSSGVYLKSQAKANASDTWRPPTSYKIEFAKKVSNPSQKEKTLHILMEQYTDRIHPRREFFSVSPEEVRNFFDLMDGEMWVETAEEEEEEEDPSSGSASCVKATGVKGRRDMAKCFTNGQRIRHKIGINKTWI